MLTPFHLAFNVIDLDESRRFYTDVLGCVEGRSTETWVDYSFFGHQLSLHLGTPMQSANTGKVGEHLVPMPHFGVVLQYDDWCGLAERLKMARTAWVIAPSVRFEGTAGEQWTMFFRDPSSNPIEIKGFKNLDQIFAS